VWRFGQTEELSHSMTVKLQEMGLREQVLLSFPHSR
jgi:hypothetical protein